MSNVLISYSEFEGSLNVRIFLPFCFFLSNCPSSFLIRSRYFYTLIVLARLSLVFPFILPICIFVRGPLTNISVAPMASIGKISTEELIPYCLSQILGGLVALELYKRYKL